MLTVKKNETEQGLRRTGGSVCNPYGRHRRRPSRRLPDTKRPRPRPRLRLTFGCALSLILKRSPSAAFLSLMSAIVATTKEYAMKKLKFVAIAALGAAFPLLGAHPVLADSTQQQPPHVSLTQPPATPLPSVPPTTVQQTLPQA